MIGCDAKLLELTFKLAYCKRNRAVTTAVMLLSCDMPAGNMPNVFSLITCDTHFGSHGTCSLFDPVIRNNCVVIISFNLCMRWILYADIDINTEITTENMYDEVFYYHGSSS